MAQEALELVESDLWAGGLGQGLSEERRDLAGVDASAARAPARCSVSKLHEFDAIRAPGL